MDIANTLRNGLKVIRRVNFVDALLKRVEYVMNPESQNPCNSFSYSDTITPKGYECGTCGKSGCKLWREYQTFLDQQSLSCCDCAGKSQKKDVSTIDEEGCILCEPFLDANGREIGSRYRCDQIGWRVPAIPTEDGSTYWGYSSVPQKGVNWWKRLPARV